MVTDTQIADSPPPAQELTSTMRSTLPTPAGSLATTGGKAPDRCLLGYGIVTDPKNGESTGQAILSQSGGALTGMASGAGASWLTARLINSLTFATGGAPAGPVVSLMAGTLGLAAGVAASIVTNDYIDGVYDEAEIEELIRKGLQEQSAAGE